MKKAKFILAVIIISALVLPLGFAKPDDNEKEVSRSVILLNNQLYNEILEVLKLPVYLAYTDKNLKGDACITMKVDKEGKLVIANIFGNNETLNKYLHSKVGSKNLWTPQKYANQYFRYKIHVK